MKKYDINSYDELLEKSTQDIDWYWNAVNEDLELRWFGSYDKVLISVLITVIEIRGGL
jgi:acetyl-CoA synthetase